MQQTGTSVDFKLIHLISGNTRSHEVVTLVSQTDLTFLFSIPLSASC